MNGVAGNVVALALCAAAGRAQAPTRVDLTGPFVYIGGAVGSVTGQSGPIGDSHAGGGWGAGAGLGISRLFAFVGNYSIFNFRDAGAPQAGPMETSDAGMRMRLGGIRTPAVFYLEGGFGLRRTSLATSHAFADDPPDDAGDMVDVDGWAGWFAPGLQIYFRRRLAGEVNVAWAWGKLREAHIQGNTITLPDPLGLTTLRLRVGLTTVLF